MDCFLSCFPGFQQFISDTGRYWRMAESLPNQSTRLCILGADWLSEGTQHSNTVHHISETSRKKQGLIGRLPVEKHPLGLQYHPTEV